jgi:hypothetical protein
MTQWGLDTLFNPAKRHMDEEKRRLLSTREEIGDSSGGKRIDLESGKVTISRAATEDLDAESAAESDVESDEQPTAKTPRQRARPARRKQAEGEPSPAAKRAAERRRRKPS